MKNHLKTSKWLRWVATGAFGVMLVFNIMISLEFEKDKVLPSLTLTELGNRAYAQGEGGNGNCISKPTNVHCVTGGSASSQCSIMAEILGVARELSVTCPPNSNGCYACCWLSMPGMPGPAGGANCFK
jgi:hypothetical protein